MNKHNIIKTRISIYIHVKAEENLTKELTAQKQQYKDKTHQETKKRKEKKILSLKISVKITTPPTLAKQSKHYTLTRSPNKFLKNEIILRQTPKPHSTSVGN